ncbi:MAG TPA: hypothetical protein VHW94_00380 [Candidatus Dormibacteraeota bacterium]|nr:hypothetical protein [Candidatus Dormibacteraeota bacterium]
MSRSPARPPDRKTRASAARPRATRREPPSGLSKVQLELRDGRYLLAYSRATSGDHA